MMTDMDLLETRLLREVAAVDGVMCAAPGNVLLVGDSGWSEPLWGGLVVDTVGDDNRLGGQLLYDRIVVTALGDADWPRVLEACWNVLRPDGVLLVVGPRVWPWGVVGTPWEKGIPFTRWQRWLRETGWRVAHAGLLGGGFWTAYGCLFLAEKNVRGGTRIPVRRVTGLRDYRVTGGKAAG